MEDLKMTSQEKKEALASYLVTKGILTPQDVDAEIVKMAATIPAATATEKGLVDDVDKAYEVMMISKGSVAPANTGDIMVQPTAGISAAEKIAINKTLIAQQAERTAVSTNTTIEKYILDRPAPSEQIASGTTGIIKPETWKKIEEQWGGKVLADDEECKSTSNFAELKAAAEGGKPVLVYIGKQATKAIGYFVNKGSVTGSSNTPVQMAREEMENFLILETAGYILASGTKPGAKLRYIKEQASKQVPGQFIPAKTVLADANKKAALEAGAYEVSREVTSEKKETGCKSDLCFKVDTGKAKSNGNGNIIRTVRVTVTAEIPTLARKVAFVDTFGTGEKISNANLETAPEGKQLANISKAQQYAIASLRAKSNDPEGYNEVARFADKLKAFDAPQSGMANAVM